METLSTPGGMYYEIEITGGKVSKTAGEGGYGRNKTSKGTQEEIL